MDLEKQFEAASNYIKSQKEFTIDNDTLLKFYGYYKIITIGNCETKRPGVFDFVNRAKWDSWNSMNGMTKEEAMQKYIDLVIEKTGWDINKTYEISAKDSSELKNEVTMGNAVSTLQVEMGNGDSIEDNTNNEIFFLSSEGNIDKVKELIIQQPELMNKKDDNGLSLLHWACDRGQMKMVQWLIEKDININEKDNDGETPLGYSILCEYYDIAKFLIEKGADVTLTNNDGENPLSDVGNEEFNEWFKNFQKEY
ncbi:ankyrin [Anaeromyces robustus]|uniref:Ankyrin n=1 Tax=Anaeromyces robustus TaxID=1754192 RepID=A0A1Y1XRW7_9FUNG|nr:ankyrin [Anaeromyces robustus]|eukprot:ORX88034.1 ankyrin [Anaeromyces robustus]